jgi:hypothetical protein
MKIILDNNYHIEVDSVLNHTLYKKGYVQSGENKGKETFTPIGYYSSVASAVKRYINSTIVDETVETDLKGYVKRIEKKYDELKQLIKS